MLQLWILMLSAVGLAEIYQRAHNKSQLVVYAESKISLIFICMTLLLGGYLGLRTGYNDTTTYTGMYEVMKPFPEFWNTYHLSFNYDPGFNLCNGIMKTLGVSTQNWLMIYALVTVGLYLHFIRKIGDDYTSNVFLFLCVGAYMFAGAAIKQSIATAICLCALPYALEKKWIRFAILVFIGMTFHFYAVVYFIVPFLMFRPWTKKTAVLLMGTLFTAVSMKVVLPILVGITSGLGEVYTVEEFSGQGVNIFRVLVCNIPTILAVFYHEKLFDGSTNKENLMFNLAMVNGCIMFIGMFGTANYFARLANYFVMAQAVVLPWIINKLSKENGKYIKIMMVIGYLCYFYYSNNVVFGKFQGMGNLTLLEYFQQAF
ncbi:MAG: EpsG family protein [Clostridiales bacterium]|nr:EpsG family protein [Clostridiales bacterium]